ncbi:putative bifunctional diguanylate cyclase/phosphodiesterase [Sulfurovum sp. ST-21]|uniref:Bifunctional diguanylate cyclase/phosphodiesterase n=1 Tax=Sulfurovum indicum TaxID=2779528 RepID=A0A7M1S4R8_9BACT|nr:bifunctional diguanylate cyclase/phosphodiesterase [Sulfurovum indicum]QOR62316.1 bifunctional diguanylate cyclase/phosphodiesterase [Sulfurovum indicum]
MEFSLETVLLCGGLIGMVIILLIIQKRHNDLKKRIEAEVQMFKKAFDISEVSILVLSDNNKIHYANQAAQKLLSLPKEYIDKALDPMPKIKIKKEWIPLDRFIQEVRQNDNEKMHSFPQSSLSVGWNIQQSIPVNFYVDRSSMGKPYMQWCNIIAIHDLSKEYERDKVIYRHKLTKLPNQLQALEDLNKLFSKIHLHNKKLALLLFEIDNFSQVRSIIGYEQCENILIHFSQYLENLAKESSFYVYHTYSNSFLLCIPVIDTVDEVVHLSKQIQRELSSFYRINDVRLHLTASVGISIYPDSGSTLNLMDRAYKALAHAQKSGYGHIHLYKKSVLEKKYDELELFNAIHEAIEKSEFEIYYQPIVRSKDKEVVAAEALIRWKHEKYGYIPPDIFIPILEKSGFIIDLGRYALSEVLKQQKRWEVFRFKSIEVSINMSLLELETEGFVENVSQMLAEHQVAPELIKFEITEGAAMENEIQTDRQLHELKKLGVSIALDDFGTGYTSFSYLKKFPADVLKIDKTMTDHIMENKEDQRIIKAMIDLGHSLGMKIVVEGVENQEMADLITSYKCDYMQGYYFGKPLPAYEFQELIRR